MGTVQAPIEECVVLHNISWQSYENLLTDLRDRSIRLTYDDGSLEIMSPSHTHEIYSRLLGQFLEQLTLELNIPIHSGGSTTFKREARKKGLEPDECYWIQHEPAMRGKTEFDPDSDPPPDLAIEIDITHSSLDRMAIYAALGVPEVWRFDGESLLIYRRQASGKYRQYRQSPMFPFLPAAELVRFLREAETKDETSLLRSFQAWVREHILPTWKRTAKDRGSQRSAPQKRGRNGKPSRG